MLGGIELTKEISVVVNARVGSSRVPRKLIRDFRGTTLLDVCLSRLSKLTGVTVYVATCEREILDIADKYAVSILNRDPESVAPGLRDQRITFAHYRDVPTSHIMCLNPCLPFMPVETYQAAISHFLSSPSRTMTSVRAKNNLFFDSEGKILNFTGNMVSTQKQKPIYEMAHAFHMFDKEFFMTTGTFWDYSPGHPELYIVEASESLDVDEPWEFKVCEALYGF